MNKQVLHRAMSFFAALILLTTCLLVDPVAVNGTSVMFNRVDSYQEYLQIIRSREPGLGFVQYKHLRCFGQFSEFSSVGDTGGWTNFPFFYPENMTYTFIDINEFEYSIEIASDYSPLHTYVTPHSETIELPDNLTDMRYLDTDETGFVKRGSLLYRYYNGKLTDVIWSLGKTCFHLYGNLYEYPMNGKITIVNMLLSGNKSIAEIGYHIMIADIPVQPGYYTPIIADAVVILTLALVTVVIVKKIRKHRMAERQANDPDALTSME